MANMTIKEAIEWQIAFKKTYNNFPNNVNEACDLAIQALKRMEEEQKREEERKSKGKRFAVSVRDTYKRTYCINNVFSEDEALELVEFLIDKGKIALDIRDYEETDYKACHEKLDLDSLDQIDGNDYVEFWVTKND